MRKKYLLIGAGFSRNWGGWLASEVFEYLIGLREVRADSQVIELLWQHRHSGGFEGALSELQATVLRDSNNNSASHSLQVLEAAVMRMFSDMNSAFVSQSFDLGADIRSFLARFDAIFSLNQDLLLERQYMKGVFQGTNPKKAWNGAYLPGVTPPYDLQEFDPGRWLTEFWRVPETVPNKLQDRIQPIIKLHGSSLWRRDEDQHGVLIIGGEKAGAISRDPLLTWYNALFEKMLKDANADLMIVGYGFQDAHINQTLQEAGEAGLGMFNINPLGSEAWTTQRNIIPHSRPEKNFLKPFLIGESRRPVIEAIDSAAAEHKKVLRFFDP